MSTTTGAKQSRRLAALLDAHFGIDTVMLRYASKQPNRGYTVVWSDGPSELEMRAAVASFAEEVPLLDVAALRYERRSYTPTIPQQLRPRMSVVSV